MKQQSYANHVRIYSVHHLIFYPLIGAAFFISCWMVYYDEVNSHIWLALAIVFLFVAWLSYITRQHYALTNQNRTVRLELRLRYFILTQQRLEEVEARLTLHQLYALRFASDEELPALVERAVTENLSPDAIKKSISNWLPDAMRV